jgi:hypothetical protein
MRSSTTSSHNIPTGNHAYSPSVPLSVYRELAAELQAAQAMLDSLNGQNQQLAKQNQQLRQEIEKAVQSVLQLQQVVDPTVVNRAYPRPEPSRPVSVPRSLHRGVQPLKSGRSTVEGSFLSGEARSGFSENLFTQEEASSYRRRYRPESASEVSGRRLGIAILLIIITAFGAGYLIVRPLLSNR